MDRTRASGSVGRACLHLLKCLCWLIGLDLFPPPVKTFGTHRQLRRWARWAVRAVSLGCLASYGVRCILRSWFWLPDKASTSDLIQIVHYVNSFALLAVGLRALWRNETFLQRLFRQNANRQQMDTTGLVACFACWLWWLKDDLRSLSDEVRCRDPFIVNWLIAASGWTSRHLFQIVYISFMLYLQCQAIILNRLRLLDHNLAVLSERQILNDKQDIRDLVSGLNRTFSGVLALMYARIFLILYTRSIMIARSADFRVDDVFSIVSPTLTATLLFFMSCQGASIVDQCERTDFCLRTKRLTRLTEREQKYVKNVVLFTRLQDSLTIWNCFPHSKTTFVSFLVSLLTCVAILVQFDYRVMAKLDRYKAKYS